jgi:hypothetical protein
MEALVSPNVLDSNAEPANPTDVLNYIASGISRLADAQERQAAALEKVAEALGRARALHSQG